jgi:hypothetical protein
LNDKWGFIDSTGKEMIPLVYNEIGKYNFDFGDPYQGFYNGLAMVALNGKWGAINKTGNLIIPAVYDEMEFNAEYESDTRYRGKLNSEWQYFDEKGKLWQSTKAKITSVTKSSVEPTASNTKIPEPPVPMKGIVDTSITGTWKYHDIEKNYGQNYSVYITFRADGTYDMYQDYTGSTPAPPPTNKNFWRIDGEYLELLYVGEKTPGRYKLSKGKDVQRNLPVLVILWNPNFNDSRTFYRL